MKKILSVLVLLFSVISAANAAELYRAGVKYSAESARREAFKDIRLKLPQTELKGRIYDNNIDENKNAVKYNLSLPDREVKLYELPFSKSYGVSYKKNSDHTYFYWHSNGYLKSVAIEAPKGPDKYPVTIYRYNPYGDLTAVSFQVSQAEEYIYNRDGTLNCHWINNVAYDEKGKQIGSSKELNEEK